MASKQRKYSVDHDGLQHNMNKIEVICVNLGTMFFSTFLGNGSVVYRETSILHGKCSLMLLETSTFLGNCFLVFRETSTLHGRGSVLFRNTSTLHGKCSVMSVKRQLYMEPVP